MSHAASAGLHAQVRSNLPLWWSTFWLGTTTLVGSVACSNDTSTVYAPNVENTADGSGTESSEPGSEPKAPLYVISTGVITGDDFLGYLTTVPSLEAGTTFNLDHAAEVGAGAWIFSRPGDNSVYVASLEAPTIVRWEVQEDGAFVRQETLNFNDAGVSSAYLAASAPIFSEEKSYFVDEDQDQLIIWNPKRMELIGTIPLGDEPMGALMPFAEGALLVHGDQLLVTVGWRDADDTTSYGDHVRLISIDTNTDQIVDSTTETRNVHAALNTQASDGTAYFSPFSLYAAYREIGAGHGAPSIVMRIDPDATDFDASYALDLSTLVGGRPAGDFTLLDDETALIRAWHPELVDPVDPADWQAVLWGEAGFYWWKWQLGAPQAEFIADQEPGTQGASVFKLDGRTYSTLYADDLESTTVVEITPSGEFVPVMTGPGLIVGSGVLRVR